MANTAAKKALVTGGAGFIGSHLVDRLVAEGWQVTVLDDLSSGHLENLKISEGPRLRFIQGTIAGSRNRHPGARRRHPRLSPGRAAVSPPLDRQTGRDHPVSGRERTSCCLSKAGKDSKEPPERFVLTSSSSVYGNTPTLPKLDDGGRGCSPAALPSKNGLG